LHADRCTHAQVRQPWHSRIDIASLATASELAHRPRSGVRPRHCASWLHYRDNVLSLALSACSVLDFCGAVRAGNRANKCCRPGNPESPVTFWVDSAQGGAGRPPRSSPPVKSAAAITSISAISLASPPRLSLVSHHHHLPSRHLDH
jgi:hypothetical protein